MTREEAILLLHDMKDTYDEIHENTNFEIGYEQMTALDMAIEALSADTVSREEYEEVKAYMDTLVDAFIEDGEELAESVKLVRCKDCKWQKFIDWGMGDCLHPKGSRHIAYDNHYCSYGERREP